MFTIDLLKGQCIPAKSRPEGIAIAAATFAVPIIIAIVMFGFYVSNIINISIQKREVVRYKKKIDELSDAIELQESFEKEKQVISSCLTEVSSSIAGHTQWSPVLMTLVENMPDSVVLTSLEVKQRFIKRKVPKKDDPQKKTTISVPVRTLHVSICGSSQTSYDRAVRDFGDRLRSSALLGPRLEDIRVSQGFDMLQNQDVVSYGIDCVFKPGL